MGKSDVERILDKIDDKIETTKQIFGESLVTERDYFLGEGRALRDLKTWIQENIVDSKKEV
jgi:hypothetical protein